MTENHKVGFMLRTNRLFLAKGAFYSIRKSEISFVLRIIKRNYKLKFSRLTVKRSAFQLFNTLRVFVGMKCSIQVAPLPHRLTWSAIVAEWTP